MPAPFEKTRDITLIELKMNKQELIAFFSLGKLKNYERRMEKTCLNKIKQENAKAESLATIKPGAKFAYDAYIRLMKKSGLLIHLNGYFQIQNKHKIQTEVVIKLDENKIYVSKDAQII